MQTASTTSAFWPKTRVWPELSLPPQTFPPSIPITKRPGNNCWMTLFQKRRWTLSRHAFSELAVAFTTCSAVVSSAKSQRKSPSRLLWPGSKSGSISKTGARANRARSWPRPWWGCTLISRVPSKTLRSAGSTLISTASSGTILSSLSLSFAPST